MESRALFSVRMGCRYGCGGRRGGCASLLPLTRERNRGTEKEDEAAAFCLRLKESLALCKLLEPFV